MASFNGRCDRKRCLQVLGLSPGASEDDIQQTYRRLALEHHPDKNNNDPEATRKFQEISQAYRILTKDDSSDDDDYFPFRRDTSYDDDDDDDDEDMFFGHSFFSMFAQELLFREMLRQMYAHRNGSSNRHQRNQQNGQRYGSQQRQGNRPNMRHDDTRVPSWARWQEQGRQGHNASRTNHFRSTQSDTSRHSFTSDTRGHDWEETVRSRQTDYRDKHGQQSGQHGQHTYWWQRDRKGGERQSDNVKEDSSPRHTTESQPRSKRRNRRSRRGREPQKIVLTQPKKLSKKELLAQEKRRQREMEKIGRELTSMQLNGDEECEESDDTKNA